MAKAVKARSAAHKAKSGGKKQTPAANASGKEKAVTDKNSKVKAVAKSGKETSKAAAERLGFLSVGRIREFLRDVRSEMRKVTWPSRKQLFASTSAVLLAILILGAYIGLLDWVFRAIADALNL